MTGTIWKQRLQADLLHRGSSNQMADLDAMEREKKRRKDYELRARRDRLWGDVFQSESWFDNNSNSGAYEKPGFSLSEAQKHWSQKNLWKYNYDAMAQSTGLVKANDLLADCLGNSFRSSCYFAGSSTRLAPRLFGLEQLDKYHVRFAPASPSALGLLPSSGYWLLPISAQWRKKVQRLGLAHCRIYDGHDHQNLVTTHAQWLLSDSIGSMGVDFYLAHVVFPVKVEKPTESDDGDWWHKYYTLTLRRMLLRKLSTEKEADGFTCPDSDAECHKLARTLLEKTKRLEAMGTLVQITGSRNVTFRQKYLGMTPILFE